MSTLQSLDKTQFKGLFNLRSAIIDFCTEEKASEIIGFLFSKCKEFEDQKTNKLVTAFQTNYASSKGQGESIVVLFLNSNNVVLGQQQLYYRNGQLSHQTYEQEVNHELIPFSSPGSKISNVCPLRMNALLRNSGELLKPKTKNLAKAIFEVITHHAGEKNTNFNIEVQTRNIKITVFVSGKEEMTISIPVSWFQKKTSKAIVQEDCDTLVCE